MIVTRTPLRISIAGGGTDLPSYYKEDGYGAVCSFAIDKYIYLSVKPISPFFDYQYKIAYSTVELAQSVSDIKHPIVREVLTKYGDGKGYDITSIADIPAGTGMGSSGAFTVGLVKALASDKIAERACHIEIDVLKEPIGKQDQYASTYGGVNYLKFYEDGSVEIEPLDIAVKELSENLLVFCLGGKRSASALLAEQSVSAGKDDLRLLRRHAKLARDIILDGSYFDLGPLLKETWEVKKRLSPHISSDRVDYYIDEALQAGATGGKLLGAGGSGFILLYVPTHTLFNVRRALSDLKELKYGMDIMGVSKWDLNRMYPSYP